MITMAHFAELDSNNRVVRVVVAESKEWCEKYLFGRWIQTSYNSAIRGKFAGIGFIYDEVKDVFIPPKPFDSWVLDEITCQWNPPVSYPNDDYEYAWDESILNWVKLG